MKMPNESLRMNFSGKERKGEKNGRSPKKKNSSAPKRAARVTL
jgi:hypothetical protein